jgi:hypothetical protein
MCYKKCDVWLLMIVLSSVLAPEIWGQWVNPAGLNWDLTGRVAFKAKGFPTVAQTGDLKLFFGPYSNPVLAEGEFLLTDSAIWAIRGNWSQDAQGKLQLQPNQTLRSTLLAELELAAGPVMDNLDIPLFKNAISFKPAKGSLSCTCSTLITDTTVFSEDGESRIVPLVMSITGKGSRPVRVSDYSWSIPTQLTVKIKKVPSFIDNVTLTVFFGPNAQHGLVEGRFAALDDFSRQFTGTFTENGGKLTVEPDPNELADYIYDYTRDGLEREYGSVSDIHIIIRDGKMTNKVKAGVQLDLSVKSHFNIDATLDGEPMETSGTFLQKGKGTPTLLQEEGGAISGSYYVDAAAGNDAYPGNSTQPWRTITHALATADPNALIYIRPGTYNAALGEVFPLMMQPGQEIIGDEVNKGIGATHTSILGHGGFIAGRFEKATIVGANGTSVRGIEVGDEPGGTMFHFAIVADGASMEIINNTFKSATYGGVLMLKNNGQSSVADNVFNTTRIGVSIESSTEGTTVEHNSFNTGSIPIELYTTAMVSDNIIIGSGEVGIISFGGQSRIENNTFDKTNGYNYSALLCRSNPIVRNNIFRCATNAVRIGDISSSINVEPDLGTAADPGENDFIAVTGLTLTHDGAKAVEAIGNIWPHTPPIQDSDIVVSGSGTVIWGAEPGQQFVAH